MGRVEAKGIVDADRRELFLYTEWCYNVPEFFSAIPKAHIVKLPDSDGLDKITHYEGAMMGREMQWEAESVEWRENEYWMMRAVTGTPAKMHMELKIQFETVSAGKTRATVVFGFRAPYPLIGPLIDGFYIRKEAKRLVNIALEGMKRAADQHKILSIDMQMEKRKADHPGYSIPLVAT